MKVAVVVLSVSLVLAVAAAIGASIIAVHATNALRANHQASEKAAVEEATRGLCAKAGEAATNAYRVRASGASESQAINILPPIASPIVEAAMRDATKFAFAWPAPTGNPINDFDASHSVSHAAYEACLKSAQISQ